MNPINVLLLKQDLADRYATFSVQAGTPSTLDRRIFAVRRQYYAIEEAIKQFIATAPPQALVGYQEFKSLADPTPSDNLNVFGWPTDAATSRVDGGLTNIVIDDEEFIHFPVVDPGEVQREINSLAMQAASPLLYGCFRNYVIDLNTKRIYAPKNRTAKIRYIKAHTPFDYNETQPAGGPTNPDYPRIPATVPIDNTHLEEISRRALTQLVGQVVPAEQEAPPQQEQPS